MRVSPHFGTVYRVTGSRFQQIYIAIKQAKSAEMRSISPRRARQIDEKVIKKFCSQDLDSQQFSYRFVMDGGFLEPQGLKIATAQEFNYRTDQRAVDIMPVDRVLSASTP